MKKLFALLSLGLIVIISGCAEQSAEKLKDRAKAEEQANRDVNNENIDQRSQALEDELQRRFRFFSGVNHTYEGTMISNQTAFVVKIDLSPSLFPPRVSRPRSLEEVQFDLNNLSLHAVVNFIDKKSLTGIGGCTFASIKPDLRRGVIFLISDECPQTFYLELKDEALNESSEALASRLYAGELSRVDSFRVKAKSKHLTQERNFFVKIEAN